MRRRLLSILFAVLLSATPPLIAQSYDVPPDNTPKAEDRSVAKEWLIGAIFLVGCLVVAFKPAKRANLR
jgi:hypothetical protein